MGKSGIRCLPPLVYGKLTGACEFAVEKVEITDKKFKNENCDIAVNVLWWGETKPLLLRPKRTQFITKDNQQVIINEQYEYSVKYEVRTKPNLFKSYLEKCEETELVVLNEFQNEVIGSTILRDLINLVFNIKYFSSPIINHSGNPIGKITCQFIFKETNLLASPVKQICPTLTTKVEASQSEEWNSDDLRLNLNLLDLCSSRDEEKTIKQGTLTFSAIPVKNTEDVYKSQRSPNAHHNTPVTDSVLKFDSLTAPVVEEEKYFEEKTMIKSLGNSDATLLQDKNLEVQIAETHSQRADECATVLSSRSVCQSNVLTAPKVIKADLKNNNTNKNKKPLLSSKKHEGNTNKNLIVSNVSKIINKKAVTSKVKSYIETKAYRNKAGSTDRTITSNKKQVRDTVKVKKAKDEKNVIHLKQMINPTGNVKNFLKVSNEISKLNKLYLNSKKEFCETHSDLEQVPVKENAKAPLSDQVENEMTKGEKNRKDFESVENPEAGTGENDFGKPGNNQDKINVGNKLHFDLSDPVEKIYYETFFLKTEAFDKEFEIAELLNEPQNRYVLDVAHEGNKLNKNSVEGKDIKKTNNSCMLKKTNNSEGDNGLLNENVSTESEAAPCGGSYSKEIPECNNDCYRCKYYKKLSELDKIIEALKNFEARLKNEGMSNRNVCSGDQNPILSRSPENLTRTREVNSDEISGGTVESNFSKEDSDFIEFTHYLSQR